MTISALAGQVRWISAVISIVLAAILLAACATTKPTLKVEQNKESLSIRTPAGKPVLTYNLRPPTNSALSVQSGGYFHPLLTPHGNVVTDFAPSDHRHHRGLFFGWVEMHGEKDADFWGWGEHAPIKDRRIVSRPIFDVAPGTYSANFVAVNDWTAEGTILVEENLRATVKATESANVLDLVYTLTPFSDITVSRWAFSGFCLRVRKDAELTVYSPKGIVTLPNPSHLKPESDWPDPPWYACSLKLKDGTVFGAAVINYPKNPPTLWHNHRDVRMINPCVVAPAELHLAKLKPFVLRYRVVTFDGPVPTGLLNDKAQQWAEKL